MYVKRFGMLFCYCNPSLYEGTSFQQKVIKSKIVPMMQVFTYQRNKHVDKKNKIK